MHPTEASTALHSLCLRTHIIEFKESMDCPTAVNQMVAEREKMFDAAKCRAHLGPSQRLTAILVKPNGVGDHTATLRRHLISEECSGLVRLNIDERQSS